MIQIDLGHQGTIDERLSSPWPLGNWTQYELAVARGHIASWKATFRIPCACTIVDIAVTPDTATAGSDGTNNYGFDAIDKGTDGTGTDSLFGDPPDTDSNEFAASDTKSLGPDQGFSLDSGDVLEVQINVNGTGPATTDWATARVQVQIEYVLR